ncbi:MAG: hypothetical protein CMO55_13335 [Verrucomicrobiales bacterium]|nr:hypothetical protein [Verrucomicrobiales bacterium]
MTKLLKPSCLLAGMLLLTLTSCIEDHSEAVLIEKDPNTAYPSFKIADSSTERFRYRSMANSAETSSSEGAAQQLVYDTPEGWTEQPASMMRVVTFRFGENDKGECYLARLPGAGGGLLANVNRWRGQMGAEPITEEEVNALPTKPLFGTEATYVTVDGSFSPGMGSTETYENYRLVGLILSSEAGAAFVKMTGPKELVEANIEEFDQFTSSLDVQTN